MKSVTHQPVMLVEVINALNIKPDGIYVDATFGRGGHAREILKVLNENGLLIVIDKDPDAIASAHRLAVDDPRVKVIHGAFSKIDQYLERRELLGKVNGILMDLGVSSPQLDNADRGFSFNKPGVLDMRMNPEEGISAAEFLRSASESKLTDVLKRYGEEKQAKKIARTIIKEQQNDPIQNTQQLADIISRVKPKKRGHSIHPATLSFQAIRIAVNDELDELKNSLENIETCLAVGGRIAVISFHSLEDRIVKRFIREKAKGDQYPAGMPVNRSMLKPVLKPIGKMIAPSEEEMNLNKRARSARLRIAERI